jgi:DNA-binding MarR family transcriptional regulator
LSKDSRDELIGGLIATVRAAQTANQMLDAAIADYLGIHGTAYRCLDILDQEGPMTAGQLAQRARLSPAATTTLLDRLEEKGYARRTRDTADRRRVLVEVTPEIRRRGEALYGPPEAAGDALAAYTDEQLEFLTEFMRGSVAFQGEKMRMLEAIRARETAPGGSTESS